MEGGVEKGLKEIQGRSATLLVRVCVCVFDRVFVCVSKTLWGEVVWISCYQQNSLSLDHPPSNTPPHTHTKKTQTPPIHNLSYTSSSSLFFFFLTCITPYFPFNFFLSVPLRGPWCEIRHVLTLHYPQLIFRQRDDESQRSPSPLGRHDDALQDGRDSICMCHDVISSNG